VGNAGSRRRLSPDTVLARASTTLERRTDTSVVLLADEPPIVLRGTGVAVWDAFSSPCSVAQAVTALAAAYGAPLDVVRRDISPVVDSLLAAHALIAEADAQ
jgi:hypothetical protein